MARGRLFLVGLIALASATGPGDAGALDFTAVTYNVGTTPGLPHNADPNDGYTQVQANISDAYYGNGLAWLPAVAAAASFFAALEPDVVAFQEVFWSDECAQIPAAFHPGFVCDSWQPGDPTVAQLVLGPNYQIACNPGKPDKCLAVHEDFGRFSNCEDDLCLDGLDGATVPGCGAGSRIGRGTIDLASGGTLAVVLVHGTSGIADADRNCRVAQFQQIFEDLDGEPAANGLANLVLADLNIDPARWIGFDPSANYLEVEAPIAGGGSFAYLSEVGFQAPPTYLGYFNLDHVLSDVLTGSCETPGVGAEPPVLATTYFDHVPIVCSVPEPATSTLLTTGFLGVVALSRKRATRRDQAGWAARSGPRSHDETPRRS
jgi:hypothetical protein